MAVTPAEITAQLDSEFSALGGHRRVVDHVRSLLVPPRREMRAWDYGPVDEYPCWLILEHESSGTGIAYCEFGFGPGHPWGLIGLDAEASMGMDSGWYSRFFRAYFESFAAADLPIWHVVRRRDNLAPVEVMSAEGSYDDTWAEVMRLRERNDGFLYDCDQIIYDLIG